MSSADTTGELQEAIHEFMSHTDVDFGYAVGNLNMDTKLESRTEITNRLEALIAAALQTERQRIADSLPEKRPGIQEYHENGETYHTCKYCGGYDECDCEGFNECLAAVKAVLIPPTGELGDSDVTTQSHPGDT